MPVPRDLVQSTVVGGTACHGIRSISVHAEDAGKNNRPVVIVELAREEIRSRKTIVLSSVMAVVLVSGNRVPAKTIVLAYVKRQPVVMTEQDGLAVTALDEFGRNCSVKCPNGVCILCGQPGMKFQGYVGGGINAGIKIGSDSGVVDRIGCCA